MPHNEYHLYKIVLCHLLKLVLVPRTYRVHAPHHWCGALIALQYYTKKEFYWLLEKAILSQPIPLKEC